MLKRGTGEIIADSDNALLVRDSVSGAYFLACEDQAAYYGEKPEISDGLSTRIAEESDLPMLLEHYQMLSPAELAEVVRRKSILLGYDRGQLVGFIGEHLEGSMGLLYVFPEYRRRGYGTALQKAFIAKTMERGWIPFGQVEKSNLNSLNLQEKIGMACSDDLIVWMWK